MADEVTVERSADDGERVVEGEVDGEIATEGLVVDGEITVERSAVDGGGVGVHWQSGCSSLSFRKSCCFNSVISSSFSLR